MEISGKLILITGASSGIGAASARMAAMHGADVILLARGLDGLNRVAAEIAVFGRKAHVFSVDLADPQATAITCERIKREVGVPDVIFNNAGVGRWLYVEETDSAELQQMIAVPYLAAFNVTRAFLPELLARNSGWIVNITSPVAFVAWPGATAYAAARWAIRGFSEALRADLYGTRIGVTLLVPGEVDSPYFDHNPGARARVPGIGRIYRTLSAEDVADMLFIALTREKHQLIRPRLLALSIWFARLFPGIVQWLTVRTGHRRSAL